MANLAKAISDTREKVRGKDVDEYLKNQKKALCSKYDLTEASFAILHSRLRVEQQRGQIAGLKKKEEAVAKAEKKAAPAATTKKKGGRPKGSKTKPK